MNIDALHQAFIEPVASYRIAPLLRINDEVNPDQLRWQVRSLKEKGCGGAFAYCERMGGGAPEPFLSEWWWDVVRVMAKACAEEGLEFWVYDEEDWPSGRAGDQLVVEHPDWCWKYIHAEEHVIKAGTQVDIPVSAEHRVGVAAFELDGESIMPGSIINLTGSVEDDRLRWAPPAGTWTVAVYSWGTGSSFFRQKMPDLMDREAMAGFVKEVYEGHWRRVRDIQGLVFKGYFTDEPCMSISMVNGGDSFPWFPAMPYSRDLPAAFKARTGLDLVASLPLVHHRKSEGALQTLCLYWRTCAELYDQHYFGQIESFCDKHGLIASGHLMGEEDFRYHLSINGGALPTYYHRMHVPGIDWINPFDSPLPATTIKYAASSAHLRGLERTWCESFAASGWGATLDDYRALVNWEHVNGINLQIPICYKHSLRGPDRAAFYNPGISYQQPYWDHFRAFADYEARLSVLAAGGGHVADVLLTYPAADIWANSWDLELLHERSTEYNRLGDGIRGAGYDFDILDDDALLSKTRIDGAALRTATETFKVVVAPRADAVRRDVLAYLDRYAEAGGHVLILGQFPEYSIEGGAGDSELASLLRRMARDNAAPGCAIRERLWLARGKGRVGCAPAVEDAVAMLRDVTPPDVASAPVVPDLFAYHRRLDDGHLYLLFNRSDEDRNLRIMLREQGVPERWDPLSGERVGIAGCQATASGVFFPLHTYPHEMVCVVLREEGSAVAPPRSGHVIRELPVEGPFRFHIEETMTRSETAWNFSEDAAAWPSDAPSIDAPDLLMPGDWAQAGLGCFSGLGHYETDVHLGALCKGDNVILDLGRVGVSAEVRVNGRWAGYAVFPPYRVAITPYVQEGSNRIEVIVANTLLNYYSRYTPLRQAPKYAGGTADNTASGLLGPVRILITE